MHLFGMFFFPFFGFGFVMYFLPSLIAIVRSKRDILGIVPQLFPGMDLHWLGRRPGVGFEDRRGGGVPHVGRSEPARLC